LLHQYNFFLSVKRFIAVTFYEKTFKASSPLLSKRNSSLNASLPLLLKVTLPTSANEEYFVMGSPWEGGNILRKREVMELYCRGKSPWRNLVRESLHVEYLYLKAVHCEYLVVGGWPMGNIV
jgi:hypothetical protein